MENTNMELVLTPEKLPYVEGNFDEYKQSLITKIEEYKKMPLTDETVAPVKSAIRQMRTTLEKIESTSIGVYFDTPKKNLKAKFAELQAIIAEGESKVDAVLAENTRIRNEETTERLTTYIISTISRLELEEDAVDHVILKKSFFNKTAKETDTLNDIDAQLAQLERNFASYKRSRKKIEALAEELGSVFNKGRFLFSLGKYADENDHNAGLAEDEAERLRIAAAEEPIPKKVGGGGLTLSTKATEPEIEMGIIEIEFPMVPKKLSKGSEVITAEFVVPKEAKKQFLELLRDLKEVGIKNKKLLKAK